MLTYTDKKPAFLFILPFLSALLLIFSFLPLTRVIGLALFAPAFLYCRETGPGRRAFAGGLLTGIIFRVHLFLHRNLY